MYVVRIETTSVDTLASIRDVSRQIKDAEINVRRLWQERVVLTHRLYLEFQPGDVYNPGFDVMYDVYNHISLPAFADIIRNTLKCPVIEIDHTIAGAPAPARTIATQFTVTHTGLPKCDRLDALPRDVVAIVETYINRNTLLNAKNVHCIHDYVRRFRSDVFRVKTVVKFVGLSKRKYLELFEKRNASYQYMRYPPLKHQIWLTESDLQHCPYITGMSFDDEKNVIFTQYLQSQ